MKSKKTWIVVADGARARIFVTRGPGTGLEAALPQTELVADSRSSDRTERSDRPGRTFDSTGAGRHAVEPPTDPQRHGQKVFAGEISKILDQHHQKKAFDQLIVIAAPRMLGDLRAALGDNLHKLVDAEIDKDLSKLSAHELADHLVDVIRI